MKIVLGCAATALCLALAFAFHTAAFGQASNAYPTMAPIEQYLMPRAAEIALARSGGPASISAYADVLVLTKRGEVVAVKGTNGWLCYVGRSWTAGLDDPEFWNPKGRGPACLNPPAVRSVLPQYLARTKWAIAGDTREEIAAKAKAAYANHQFTDPAPGSLALMLSKDGYLLGADGPWHPHVMPFVAQSQMAMWGAGFKGSPVETPPPTFRAYEPVTLAIPVSRWSDGSISPPVKSM